MKFDYKLDKEELEILDEIDKGNFKSIENVEQKIQEMTKLAKNFNSKTKKISLRVKENDLNKLRVRALEMGIPYQTLINSIIHKFVNGNIVM